MPEIYCQAKEEERILFALMASDPEVVFGKRRAVARCFLF